VLRAKITTNIASYATFLMGVVFQFLPQKSETFAIDQGFSETDSGFGRFLLDGTK